MAEQEKDPTPVEQMQAGEKWQVDGGNDIYLITKVDLAAKKCRMKPVERKGDTDYGYEFEACKRAKMHRVAKAPKPHDFTDPYCAAKHADGVTIVQFCRDCGLDGSEPGECKPDPNWRTKFEAVVAELTAKKAASTAQERPRYQFRQSHPITAGGVFSLRDEAAQK